MRSRPLLRLDLPRATTAVTGRPALFWVLAPQLLVIGTKRGIPTFPISTNTHKELLAIELRLLNGVDLKNFQARHGTLPNEVLLNLEMLQNKEWIERDDNRIKLSPEGLLFYDSI